jgi:hypothetical protein
MRSGTLFLLSVICLVLLGSTPLAEARPRPRKPTPVASPHHSSVVPAPKPPKPPKHGH